MRFYAYHGVFPEENKLGQFFVVDLEAGLDLRAAGVSDRLEETIDYADLYAVVEKAVTGQVYQLVEAVAEAVAAQVLSAFPPIQEVRVRVTKPHPPIPGQYSGVAVEIKRRRKEPPHTP